MASNSAVCGVCGFRNITKPSVVWCSECSEGLCTDCNEHHSASRLGRNHNTVAISDYQRLPTVVIEMSSFCSKHKEKYQTFCKKHDCPCCRKCVIESHNKCEDITTIDDVIHNVKTSNAFMEIEQTLSDVVENIDKIIKNRRRNLTTLFKQRSAIEKEIENLRMKINKKLDKVQEDIIKSLNKAEEDGKTDINTFLENLEMKHTEAKENQSTISNLKQYASELQTFLALKQIENDVAEKEKFIEKLMESESMCQRNIVIKPDKHAINFDTFIETFGEIITQTTPSEANVLRKKENQAQMMVTPPPPKHIDNLKLTKIQTINHSSTGGRFISGCSLFPDGKIVLTMRPIKGLDDDILRVLSSDGSNYFKLSKYYMLDTAYIEEIGSIVVSCADTPCPNPYLMLIDAENRKVKKTISIKSLCTGMAYTNNTLFFCAELEGIKRIDLADETVKLVCSANIQYDSYIAAYKDCIYYTNSTTHSVTCCDMQGTIKWVFRNDNVLNYPLGVSVDNTGNVFVVGRESKNVVVLSSDGLHYRELLTRADGMGNLTVLDIDRSSNKLLVVCERDMSIFQIC